MVKSDLTETPAAGATNGSRSPAAMQRFASGAAVVGVLILIAIYRNTSLSMLDLWSRMHAFDHAFLILPVCLYLIWDRWGRLTQVQSGPSLIGIVLLAGFGLLWMVADAVDVTVGRQFALIGMVESLVLAIIGWRAFRIILFPMAFLWLVLPTDLNLLPPMQRMAANAASHAIRWLGIPVFLEDVYIELPTGRFWVAPGCAGLNFLLSGLALAILFAEQMYTSWAKRIACVLTAIAMALVANILRIAGLIVASYYLHAIYNIKDHYLEGWIFFAFVMFIMMWIGWRFRDPVAEEAPVPAAWTMRRRPVSAISIVAVFVAVLAVAGFFPALAALRTDGVPVAAGAVQVAAPQKVGGWRLLAATPAWNPKFARADAERTVLYGNGSKRIDLYVAYYAYQGEGREVAEYGNRVYDDDVWQWLETGSADAKIGAANASMTTMLLRHVQDHRNVWYAYWVDGRYTGSPVVAKLLQAKSNLLGGERRAGFIAIAAEKSVDAGTMRAFLSALPSFPALIRSAAPAK